MGTSVTTHSVEVFHPKTTPKFDVVQAVKISSALPGKCSVQMIFVSYGVEKQHKLPFSVVYMVDQNKKAVKCNP